MQILKQVFAFHLRHSLIRRTCLLLLVKLIPILFRSRYQKSLSNRGRAKFTICCKKPEKAAMGAKGIAGPEVMADLVDTAVARPVGTIKILGI